MDVLHLQDFFKHQSAFPNFKKKGKSDVKMYFVKNNTKDCRCERHRLNIPTLGGYALKKKVIYQQLKRDGKSKAVQYPSKQADTMCQFL